MVPFGTNSNHFVFEPSNLGSFSDVVQFTCPIFAKNQATSYIFSFSTPLGLDHCFVFYSVNDGDGREIKMENDIEVIMIICT